MLKPIRKATLVLTLSKWSKTALEAIEGHLLQDYVDSWGEILGIFKYQEIDLCA